MEKEDKMLLKQAENVFADLLESLIVDVASEAHRAARLGMDPRLNINEEEEYWLSVQARTTVGDPSISGSENNKHGVDIFGQTHPAVATEVFECMNCNRNIMAGRFAPHLEKCMGKGRRARLKTTRNTNSVMQRKTRAIPAPASMAITSSRTPTRTLVLTPEDLQRNGPEVNEGTSDDGHEDDDKEEPSKSLQGEAPKRVSRSTVRQT